MPHMHTQKHTLRKTQHTAPHTPAPHNDVVTVKGSKAQQGGNSLTAILATRDNGRLGC
jgi:hypothetical protein